MIFKNICDTIPNERKSLLVVFCLSRYCSFVNFMTLRSCVNMERRKIKVAYIGGGSRGWAWILMKDLAKSSKICGEVALYDIDFEAAKDNEIIGNSIKENNPEASEWTYKAEKNIGDALTGANFVVVSILPGTFDEMRSESRLLICASTAEAI